MWSMGLKECGNQAKEQNFRISGFLEDRRMEYVRNLGISEKQSRRMQVQSGPEMCGDVAWRSKTMSEGFRVARIV